MPRFLYSEMFEAVGLTKSYNARVVVDNVSLSIHSGEAVGLLGKNGAGKKTTFHKTIGLLRPENGKVKVNGEDIGHQPMYIRTRKGITYLTQEPSIFGKLSVNQNILVILESLNLSRKDIKRRLVEHLGELNITHLAGNQASCPSGGERRRVEIARALVFYPQFILLDEPFAGIDPIKTEDNQCIIRSGRRLQMDEVQYVRLKQNRRHG